MKLTNTKELKNMEKIALDGLLVFFLVTLPFASLRICKHTLFGIEIKPQSLLIYLILFSTLTICSKNIRKQIIETSKRHRYILGTFIGLNLTYAFSLDYGSNLEDGKHILLKNLAYALLFPCLTTNIILYLRSLKNKLKTKYIVLVSFTFVWAYIAQSFAFNGRNVLLEMNSLLLSDNPGSFEAKMQMDTLRYAIQLCGEGNTEAKVFNRNMFAYINVLFVFLVNIWNVNRNALGTIFQITLNILLCLAVISTQSRGGIICLSLIYLSMFIWKFVQATWNLKITLIIGITFLALFGFTNTRAEHTIKLLYSRMLNTSIEEEYRWHTYSNTWKKIKDEPIFGHGIGTKVTLSPKAKEPTYVHNLFLGSWLTSGILGLLTSFSFVIAIVALFIKQALLKFRNEKTKEITFWLVPTLLVYPILHLFIGGNNGNPDVVTWTFLAFIFAISSSWQYKKSRTPNEAI